MNNEELKKKIAQIIAEYCCPLGKTHKQLYCDDRQCYSKMNFAECEPITECTDALIAAGIGDVKDLQAQVNVLEITNIALQAGYDDAEKDRLYWVNKYKEAEYRAEVAERALDKATELAYTYRTQDDTLSCSSCPFDGIFDKCKEHGLYKECSKRWKEELLHQAEKELAEENNVKN